MAAADIRRGEKVLEIGPGTGFLTRGLLAAGAEVIAIEKDGRAMELLKDQFSAECANGHLKIIRGDVLVFDPTATGLENAGYALIANIPYYITGAILEKFLEKEPRPNRMVMLVQKEVAERIIARDGKESILSISVKAFSTPKIMAKVPRGAFYPPPNVDSAILSIMDISDKRFKENGVSIEKFFRIVKAGFAHKRKLLRNNLEGIFGAERIDAVWRDKSLSEKVRAEDLNLEKWFDLERTPW